MSHNPYAILVIIYIVFFGTVLAANIFALLFTGVLRLMRKQK